MLIHCYDPESHWSLAFRRERLAAQKRKPTDSKMRDIPRSAIAPWTWRWTFGDNNVPSSWFEAWRAYTKTRADGWAAFNELSGHRGPKWALFGEFMASESEWEVEGSVLAWERFFSWGEKEALLSEKNSVRLCEGTRCRGQMLCIHFLQAEWIWYVNRLVKMKGNFLCWGIHEDREFS